MAFSGFPIEAFDFFARLELDNSRTFWLANKSVYESAVKVPFIELSDAVEPRFGALRRFRPYRDVRFSKDKTPYKTAAGAAGESDGGSAYYAQVSSEGLFVGCGMYSMGSDQLERFRSSIDNAKLGAGIAKIVESLRSDGYDVASMDALKTAPRGYAIGHPRIDLLRMKGLTMGKTFPLAKWMHTPKALERIIGVWDDALPMNTWLDRHVGASAIAPREPD